MSPQNATSNLDFDAIRCLGAPLSEKLSLWVSWTAANKPEAAKRYDDLVERLTLSGATDNAVKSGSPLEPFLLPDTEGHLQGLQNYLVEGPLVVSFNRGHWCPYCLLELRALEEIHSEVNQLGGSIISITPQRAASANRLKEKSELTFPILSDIDNAYALSCGIMMSISDAVDKAYKNIGIDLAADQGNDGMFLPMPATYVVNKEGVVVADYVHPDFRTRMPPQDILTALQANSD